MKFISDHRTKFRAGDSSAWLARPGTRAGRPEAGRHSKAGPIEFIILCDRQTCLGRARNVINLIGRFEYELGSVRRALIANESAMQRTVGITAIDPQLSVGLPVIGGV